MWQAKRERERGRRRRGGKMRGRGNKKAARGREENIVKDAWEGSQPCYVLKTFPTTTLNVEGKGRKKGKRGRKKVGLIFRQSLGTL